MSLARTVGLRYLRAKRGSRFVSLISGFSVLGVAIGVATLIVVLSVMDGFEGALKDRLARGEFHVLVVPNSKQKQNFFTLSPEKISEIFSADSRILAVNPVVKTEAMMRAGKRVAGVSVRGIAEAQMNSVAPSLIEAKDSKDSQVAKERQKIVSANGIWLGKELAYQLNILPGDKVSIISPTETEGPLESVPRMRTLTVEGIFDSGIPEKDLHVVYAPQPAVREFLGLKQEINQIEIQTHSFEESVDVANSVRAVMGDNFSVRDWQAMNAHLFASLRLERITMFVILAMIILVASFNIVTSLTMLVSEKRKDIAILKAMGASSRQIGRIFLVQGAIIGNAGTLLGLVLGVGISLLLKHTTVIELPDVFYDRSLPVKLTPVFIALIVSTAVLIVLGASWFPARSASRLTPLDGFREG
jgi:lipoprotein-releasing system permease protein